MIGLNRSWKLRGGVGGALLCALAALAFASLAPAESPPRATSTDDAAHAALLQPNGRIVALGTSSGRLALARYLPDGSLDPSFGDGGKVTTDIGPGVVGDIDAAALAPGGRIVAAGRAGESLLVARYDANGSLDTSFGHDGVTIEPCCAASSVAVAPDGGIIVAAPSRNAFQLRRLTPDGGFDRSFGSNGRATVDVPAPAAASAVAVQPDGEVVAAGTEGSPVAGSALVVRFNPDGSSDPSFGDGGVATAGALTSAAAIAIQPDGALLVGGSTATGPAVARVDSAGALDPAFGTAGTAILSDGSTNVQFDALALERNGDVAAGGDSVLAMLSAAGAPAPGFTAGATVSPAAALLPTSNGGVVSVGAASGDFALTRLLSDGAPDGSFGEAGTVVTDFTPSATRVAAPPARHTGATAPAAGRRHRKPHRMQPPHPVPAWYINADNVTELKRFAAADACNFANAQPKRAHRTLIMDFGGARAYSNGSFGAAVNNASFAATNRQIRLAMKVAADAYAACHKRGQGKIVYGVTNHFKYKSSAVLAHAIGVHQSSTVKHVWNYIQRRGYYPTMRTGVAGDIETGYWGPKYSKAMVNGAGAEWARGYIDFGTAGGCPPHPGIKGHKCFNDWTLDDVAHVSNSGGGDPLPEIYYRGGRLHFDQAAQWARVAHAWNHQHATPFAFAGTTGSTQFSGLTPGASWRRLVNKTPGHVGRELVNFKEDHWVAKSSGNATR